jgi:hypothetical protein
MKKVIGIVCLIVCFCGMAQAQELGHYMPGIMNIRDMAVPPQPGFYYAQYNFVYTTDKLLDGNGDEVKSITSGPVTVNISGFQLDSWGIAPTFIWVTEKKLFGGDYGIIVAPTIVKNQPAATLSTLRINGELSTDNAGLGDLFVQPLWLGWHGERYDLSLGLGLYLPIGEYESGAANNIGMGFMTGQVQGAGYFYLDKQQTSALMLAATYEMHTEKLGTVINPGDHFTLEYGFSQYLTPQLEVGLTGSNQWQIQGDDGSDTMALYMGKNQVHSLGGQVGYWITPQFNLAAKYNWEYGAKARFEGHTFGLNFTYTPMAMF